MRARRWVIVVTLLAALAARAHAAPELVFERPFASDRALRAIFEPALRAPEDSSALSAALGGTVGELQERGYWQARAQARWESGPRLRVAIAPGPRLRLASLELRATPAADSARIAHALELTAGGWAGPQRLSDGIQRAVGRLVHDGYPYAELGVAGMATDSSGAHVVLAGVLGPRVTITDVRVEGLHVTRPDVARRAMGRLVGMPYRPEAAEAARIRLAQLGLFRDVAYQGLEGASDWSRGTLVYRAEEPKYNRFEGVVGSQGAAGTVGTASLALGNVLGTGRAVALDWDARGHGSSDLGASYVEPLVLGLPLALEGELHQELRDSTYTRTRWGGRARWTLTAEDGITIGFEEEAVVQPHDVIASARLENTVFGLTRVTFDDPLGPTRGMRVAVEATQTFSRQTLRPEGAATTHASTITLASEWIAPIGLKRGVSVGLEGAGRFSSDAVLPVYERFSLGGAASLRGYDEDAFRVDRYLLSHVEGRWYLGSPRQRTYLFWDHAWAGTRLAVLDQAPRWDTFHKDGVGFGLRLETAAGLAGLDYGLEPGRPPLEGKIHVRLVSTF